MERWSGETKHGSLNGSWSGSAPELALFAFEHLFVRTDAFGEFLPGKQGVTTRESPSPSLLEDHFRGSRCVGPHTTSEANESLFGVLDLDSDDDLENRQKTLQLAQHLRDRGFAPLIEESRQNRFHLWIRFPDPVPTLRLFSLLQATARTGTELGLKKVETFPKQASLRGEDGRLGNWIRLFGRHPEVQFFSRIYDAETDRWLEGDQAGAAVLEWRASSPDLLPETPTLDDPSPRISTASADARIPEGSRDTTLTSLGGGMRRKGFSPEAIDAALQETNRARCTPPLAEAQVSKIARSLGRYDPAQPAEEALAPLVSRIEPVRYLDLDHYARDGIPEIQWRAVGWMTTRDIILVAGAGGIGKSTTMAAWALAQSLGMSFCGIETVEPVRVLYLDEEMGEMDTARLFLRLGAPAPNLRVASCQGFRFDTEDGIARLAGEIEEWGAQIVFGDSVQQLFGNADENSAHEVGRVYRSLFRLRDSLGVSFVLAHHKKKNGPFRQEKIELVRGSTAHATQASCVLFASPGEGSRLNLEQVKRRGSSKRSLCIRYEEDTDGRITLTGEGEVHGEAAQSELARDWVLDYVVDRGRVDTAELKKAAFDAGLPWRSVQRALAEAIEAGELKRPKRGVYVLPKIELFEAPKEDS